MSCLAFQGQVVRLMVESYFLRPQPPAGSAPLLPYAPIREAIGTEVRGMNLEPAWM